MADLNLTAAEQTAKEITAAGGTAIAVKIDVTRTASVESAVRAVEAALGPVEVVVNNAGWDDFMPFVQTTEEFWDKILDINFKGALRVIKTVVPGMMDRGFGRVINIGSDAGRVGSSLEAVYSGAKGGIIAFTKTLAREVAAEGSHRQHGGPRAHRHAGPAELRGGVRRRGEGHRRDGPSGPDEAARHPRGHRPGRRLPRLRRRRLRHGSNAVGQRRPDDGLSRADWRSTVTAPTQVVSWRRESPGI